MKYKSYGQQGVHRCVESVQWYSASNSVEEARGSPLIIGKEFGHKHFLLWGGHRNVECNRAKDVPIERVALALGWVRVYWEGRHVCSNEASARQ